MSSILNDVKSYCQVESDDDSFDNDIITLANAFLDDCKQVGVGDDDFELSDAELDKFIEDMIENYNVETDISIYGFSMGGLTALNYCEIPSATISLGYLTNETDEANLVSEWYKEVLIKGLADGLDAYFK